MVRSDLTKFRLASNPAHHLPPSQPPPNSQVPTHTQTPAQLYPFLTHQNLHSLHFQHHTPSLSPRQQPPHPLLQPTPAPSLRPLLLTHPFTTPSSPPIKSPSLPFSPCQPHQTKLNPSDLDLSTHWRLHRSESIDILPQPPASRKKTLPTNNDGQFLSQRHL
jgi:hypothetical protein